MISKGLLSTIIWVSRHIRDMVQDRNRLRASVGMVEIHFDPGRTDGLFVRDVGDVRPIRTRKCGIFNSK